MVTVGIFRFKENSHGRAGNRTRDLTISSQRLWPLDHEAGLKEADVILNISFLHWCFPAAVYTDMKAIPVNVRRKPLLPISKIDTKQGFVLAKANRAQGRYICMYAYGTNTITTLVIRMLERIQKFPSIREIPRYYSVQNRPPMDPTLILYSQVFLGFLVSISKCWDVSQDSKLPLHASHVALPTEIY